ncbi:MAG: glycine betaine ABC transporter substrate-binding protein [Thermoleophilaceae bacterium]
MAARVVLVAALAAALVGCGGGGGGSSKPGGSAPAVITLGTKNFTEQYILGELYRQTLEKHGFRVRLKSDVGSSEIIDKALTAGSLDMYPEYTGVLLSEIAGDTRRLPSAGATYARAQAFEQKRGFTLLAMTPFSDSNALVVKPGYAAAHHLRTIADLVHVPAAVIGALPEFRTRFEGSVGLRRLYGVRAPVKALALPGRYPALDHGLVDVLAGFTTEGRLSSGRYRVLGDPRRLFAFQNLAPVIRTDLVRKYGSRLTGPLDALSRRLTTAAMRAMNAAVDLRGQKPAAVAARFLRSGS